jgi:hypothetical protein
MGQVDGKARFTRRSFHRFATQFRVASHTTFLIPGGQRKSKEEPRIIKDFSSQNGCLGDSTETIAKVPATTAALRFPQTNPKPSPPAQASGSMVDHG